MGRIPRLTLAEIAQMVGGEVSGDAQMVVTGVAGVESAGAGDLVFVESRRWLEAAFGGEATGVLTTPQLARPEKPCVLVENPRLAFVTVLEQFRPHDYAPVGISPHAFIASDAKLGSGVGVGEFAWIGPGTSIGENSLIFPLAFIGARVKVGADCKIYPGAVILDRVTIGDRAVIHPGAVIGKEGFGFVWDGKRHRRIPQLGAVIIEDDVEIGANTCIDRATLGATIISRGTKIDNQVQVAHNCRIGQDCILCGQVGLAGSVVLDERVTVGGQAGIADHVHVGHDSFVAAGAGVMGELPVGSSVSGYPARPHRHQLRVAACLQKLPELVKIVQLLQQELERVKERLEGEYNH